MYESNHQKDRNIIPLDAADASIKLLFLQFLKLYFITLASLLLIEWAKLCRGYY